MDISIISQLGVPNETEVKKAIFFVNEKKNRNQEARTHRGEIRLKEKTATPQHPYSLSSSSPLSPCSPSLLLPNRPPADKHCPTLVRVVSLLWKTAGPGATGQRKESAAWLLPRGAVFGQGIKRKIYSVSPVLLEGLEDSLLCKYASGLSVLPH